MAIDNILPVTFRPYEQVAAALSASGATEHRMQAVADALWEVMRDKGVSWVGFYLDRSDATGERCLELGPYRDKPACTPIGLHGVCGQALRFGRSRIVHDVTEIEDEYITCDPRDRSEITVPLVDEGGVCWGVLDLDSWDVGAFDESDEQGLCRVLEAAGFLTPRGAARP